MKRYYLTSLFFLLSGLLQAQIRPDSSSSPSIRPATGTPKADIPLVICSPSRSAFVHGNPLYIVYSRNKRFALGDSTLSYIKPQFIKSIEVLKNENATNKYGEAARAGAIEIYINDEKYPAQFKELRRIAKKRKIKV